MNHRTQNPTRDQRGAISPFIVLLMVALLAMAGLVYDGGSALAAKRRAMTAAEQAARVGADALDPASLRDGTPTVSTARAIAASQNYLSDIGESGSVTVNGGTVTVVVTDSQPTAILSVVGLNQLEVSAEASAVSIDANG